MAIEDLKNIAAAIKTQTKVGGNTANIIGDLFEKMLDLFILSTTITQSTGTDPAKVMSQKAVTQLIVSIQEAINNINKNVKTDVSVQGQEKVYLQIVGGYHDVARIGTDCLGNAYIEYLDADQVSTKWNIATKELIATIMNKDNATGLNRLFEKLAFNVSTAKTLTDIGEVFFNAATQTLELKMTNDVTLQIGQEMLRKVKNDSGVVIGNGKLVYVSGGLGANALVKLATTADANAAQRTFGMATQDITVNGTGFITLMGDVNGLNTTGIAEGSELWLGTEGNYTVTEPTGATPKIYIGRCLRSHATQGVIGVNIRPIPRMHKLSGVSGTPTTTGQIYRYNATTSCFELYDLNLLATKEEVNQIGADLNQVSTNIGEDARIVTPATNFVNLSMGVNSQTEVWSASSGYDSFIVEVKAGQKYSLMGTYSSCRAFIGIPAVGTSYTAAMERSPNIEYTESVRSYLLICVNTSNFNVSISLGNYGIIKRINTIETNLTGVTEEQERQSLSISELENKVGENEETKTLTQLSGIIWNGTKYVAANTSFNSFIIEVKGGQTLISTVKSGQLQSARVGLNKPVIDLNDTNTDISFPYTPSSRAYVIITFTLSGGSPSIDISLSNYGLVKDVENIKSSSSLADKKVVFFGDSITEFNDSYNKGYADYFAEISKATTIRGGIGGTQLGQRKPAVDDPSIYGDTAYQYAYGACDIPNIVEAWATNNWTRVDTAVAWLKNNPTYNDDNTAIINRLKGINIADTDVVVVLGGSNDLNAGSFGTHGDGDRSRLCGGIDFIINTLLTAKPTLEIYFFTPLPRMATADIWSDDYRKNEGDGSLSFISLVNKVKETANANHIPCADIYHEIGITTKNIYTYAADGVHVKGAFPRIARYMYSFINSHKL